jgi:pullulanase-type alpha-1,6-glucosidase
VAFTDGEPVSSSGAASPAWLLVHYQRGDAAYDDWGLYTWGGIDADWSTDWPAGLPFAGIDSYGRFAWVRLRPGARNVGFIVVDKSGVPDVAADRFVDLGAAREVWLRQGDPTIYRSQAAATGQVIVHYGRPDGGYAGWGLQLWGDGLAPGVGTDWSSPRPADGIDEYGAYWNVSLADPTKVVRFVVHHGDDKDPGADQSVDPTFSGDAWVRSGESTVHPTRAAAEHAAVLHYRRTDGDYAGWGLELWDGPAGRTEWTSPMLPSARDTYGLVFRVRLSDSPTGLSYIVHRGDTKDLPEDQRLEFATGGHEVWIQAGVRGYLRRTPPTSTRDVDIVMSKAHWIDRATIAWQTGPTDGKVYDLVVASEGGLSVVDDELAGPYESIRLEPQHDGLTEAQRDRLPHLSAYQSFRLSTDDLGRIAAALRGQLVVTERDHMGHLLSATGVQIPAVLDDVYAAATHVRLGPTFEAGRPSLAVWAPTAHDVALELFDTPADAATTVAMRRDADTGVWRAAGPSQWRGRYYRYRVTAWQPAAQGVVTASVTDPYSVSLAADSTHSQIVDLSDKAYAPRRWARLHKPPAVPTVRTHIQEVSVRDFSIADTTVPAAERGTYLAFTHPDAAGMSHLRSLARAGVTHLHVLPAFDFATIPERRSDQAVPDCDLASLPPDSSAQQECVEAVVDTDGYNWGYDPLHYTVPEGGYATDPDGLARIRQFRQMVAGVNRAGLRLVMDVVFNHTAASGIDRHSVLDQIVPGYYHRLLLDGTVATSTCCANTAPEHAMMGKLVVDSVVTWASQYKVDGFRFDLMGHHPKENILAVRHALDRLTVARDGVDGMSILLYGEGWNFGEVAGDARFVQATQANMAGTGIGTFNDRLRDAVRGGGSFDANPRRQGFASGLLTDPNGDPINGSTDDQRARLLHQQDLIKVGLVGNLAGYGFVDSSGAAVTGAQVDYNGSPAGYTDAPGEAVTYVDAHDNEILYDALAYKLPAGTSAVDRARMQVLALSIVVLGQGVGFVTAGSERLRSKSLDRNSFNSGDWFNQIRWNCADGNGFRAGLPRAADNEARWPYAKPLLADPALVPPCEAINLANTRYAELLRVRASSPVFALGAASEIQKRVSFPLSGPDEAPGVIAMTMEGRGIDHRWRSVTVVFNATKGVATQTVAAMRGADVALHPVLARSVDPAVRAASFDAATGTFSVPGRTVAAFVER